MTFGMPCIFLTVTPDDKRSYRIMVYALHGQQSEPSEVDVNKLSDKDIIFQHSVRKQVRSDYPGLCAEEYSRVIDLVIKHLLCWDCETEQSTGVGLFGKVLAWCLATEEQGRKTLHGHFLIYVEGWKSLLNVLQKPSTIVDSETLSYSEAVKTGKEYYKNVCSANLFKDFQPPTGVLNQVPLFQHTACHRGRTKRCKSSVQPVKDQQLREMRHKAKCQEHNGHIATCLKCDHKFTVQSIVSKALSIHCGNGECNYNYPDVSYRLDRYVYELQKNFTWTYGDETQKARRYFASNALSNIHLVKHTRRCFKKGPECYANLPDKVTEGIDIIYTDEDDLWSDWYGEREKRRMFRFSPRRPVEDVFVNAHNPELTTLLGANNNVMVGMNGRSVFYVTGYQTKLQQTDERELFTQVSNALMKVMEKQVCTLPDCGLALVQLLT